MKVHPWAALAAVSFALGALAGCSGQSNQVTVLELVPPEGEAQVTDTPGATEGSTPEETATDEAGSGEANPDEATSDEATSDDDLSGEEIGNDATDSEGTPASTPAGTPSPEGTPQGAERSDQEIAADVAAAIKSTSNIPMDFKIQSGSEISGRTACTGVPDTSTQYPIGLELIVGPPGKVGSGTPRIVARTYDDDAMAKAAAAARIASLESCIANATANNPALEWGTVAVASPMVGEQLWFPAGAVTETHVAYSVENFYIVVSNQVPAATFVPGQVDAWSISAVQAVIDTVEAEANPTPTPGQ